MTLGLTVSGDYLRVADITDLPGFDLEKRGRHWTLSRQEPQLNRCAVPRLDSRMRLCAMARK